MAENAENIDKPDPVFNPPNENGEDTIMTLQDVLDEQEELENAYAAVLGGSDEKNCTYSKVYSCLRLY